ncbi:PLP-dependent aminotransferase family protein [Spirillospora sp. NPDC047279]|uniref:MocR-like pyridoxine biosynthesis transcription factor PdxR n=1 Tax=Spirillospora sp. NPDC047279 TaxID=3155478 RepID=UPI0033F34A3B
MRDSWSGSDLHLELDPARKRRAALESALRTAIQDGRLTAGTLLPSTRALATELALSRGTVTAAYDQLAEEGFLTIRPGSGTRVADIPQTPAPPPAVLTEPPAHDLRPGRPAAGTFPTRAWLAATRRVLHHAAHATPDPQGQLELRTALAAHLGRTRGVRTDPTRIVVTSGYHQAVTLLAHVLRQNGVRTTAYEDPGHNAYREAVQRGGLTTTPLPVDARGAQVESLTTEKAVFLTPSHQYPLGVPLHPHRRRAIRTWARSTGALIIEDDYDGEFRYDRQPIGALQALAPDHVVYAGSISKTLSPNLRLGWLALPHHLVSPFVQAKEEADTHTETLTQLVLADLIASHAYDRHIRACRLRYSRRRRLLLDRLAAFSHLTVHGVPAGLSTLVTGMNEQQALAVCTTARIALRGLTELHQDPGTSPGGLLIGFAAPSDSAYPAALTALSNALTTGRLN